MPDTKRKNVVRTAYDPDGRQIEYVRGGATDFTYNEIEALEDDLEMANSTVVGLRALLACVIGIVHDNTSYAEKVSDIRQLLREAGEL